MPGDPKGAFATIFAMPPALFGAVAASVVKVARAVDDLLQPGGLSVLQANGALAGQTVPHVHVHVLPRRLGDNLLINWDRERTAAGAADPPISPHSRYGCAPPALLTALATSTSRTSDAGLADGLDAYHRRPGRAPPVVG